MNEFVWCGVERVAKFVGAVCGSVVMIWIQRPTFSSAAESTIDHRRAQTLRQLRATKWERGVAVAGHDAPHDYEGKRPRVSFP